MANYDSTLPEVVFENLKKEESINEVFQEPGFLPEDKIIVEEDDEIVLFEGPDALEEATDPTFDDNLAETLSDKFLSNMVTTLIQSYEDDKKGREKRDVQQSDTMRKAGLDPDASSPGAEMEGSATVNHPALKKACVEFAARSSRELCPPSGAVKSKIIGEATSKKINEAQRKCAFLNELVTVLMPYRNVLQQSLSQVPIGGSQYIKFWHDPYLRRPNCEFLPIDNVYFPAECNDFYTAERVTIQMDISAVEYWRRIKEGVYYDPEYTEESEQKDKDYDENSADNQLVPQSLSNAMKRSEERSRSERLSDKVEGVDKDLNQDEGYSILEMYVYLKINDDSYSDGEYSPYIVIMRQESEQIIGIYRNWDIEDKKKHKLDWIAEFYFIPWRGAYKLGLGALIGDLNSAATGALRGLLDSAHINNVATGLYRKGFGTAGQSPDIQIGRLNAIDGANGMDDDIRKSVMMSPFNPPSPVLFQLLEFLTDQSERVIKVPDGTLNAMGDRTPANTTLAMIEQSSTTQSAIHSNLHFSQMRCFEIICRILYKHFDKDGYPEWLIDDLKINGQLFADTRDIVPVSDPNIFTEVQRYAQLDKMFELAEKFPGKINQDELLKRSLQQIKIPQPDLLLNLPTAVSKCNAVAENAAVMMGDAIEVYPDQNHLDHLYTHLEFLKSPIFGQNAAINSNNVQMIQHCKSHLMYFYAQVYQQQIKNRIEVDKYKDKYNVFGDEDVGDYDDIIRDVTPSVMQFITEKLGPYLKDAEQVLSQLMKMQQEQQQQNMSPEHIKLQIERAKLQQAQASAQSEQQKNQIAAQESQGKMQLEQQKVANQAQTEQMRSSIEQMKAQSADKIAQLQYQAQHEEAQSGVAIEQLRLEQQRMDALNKLKIEVLKHREEQQSENLRYGHELGLQVAEHRAEIEADREKHRLQLESDEKVSKSTVDKIN